MNQLDYSIFGFISYSRKDKRIANWLHAQLENYAYPIELVDEYQRPPHKKYVCPIFLDTKDLQVEERPFTEEIKESLRRSKFLLLICSRNSAQSPYVDLEIKYFIEAHNRNYALIVPLFIDEVTEDSIPPAIKRTSIMERHFPIFNTLLGDKSEGNVYCFLQVVSYLLGVDFHSLYNRYEEREKKKQLRTARFYKVMLGASLFAMFSLVCNIYSLHQMVDKERELLSFERDVFPRAVVYGYLENFLVPVIKYLKNQKEKAVIHILLPNSEKDVTDHQNRFLTISSRLDVDSLITKTLPTVMKRGSRIIVMMKEGRDVSCNYIDFATTTSSFLKVAEYKKKHDEYEMIPISQLISDYSISFMKQTKELLEDDSIYVKFYLSATDMVEEINHVTANYPTKNQ